MLLNYDDEVVLLGCSNGLSLNEDMRGTITDLYDVLVNEFDLKINLSPTVYVDPMTNETHDANYRKSELYQALLDPNIKAIFDLTGGDLANEVLVQFTEEDWRAVESVTNKFYVGYSDNSVILNALMTKTKVTSVNFLLTNLIYDKSGTAKEGFKRVFFNGERIDRQVTIPESLPEESRIIGGNIRCYLKLAGTPFLSTEGADGLLLEAHSGDIFKVRTYFAQLDLLNIFDKVEFVVIGKFTEIEKNQQSNDFDKLIQTYQNKHDFKLYFTDYVGHQSKVYPFVMN